jgi:DNA-directed RNA polymerases I, II, and III subunit RPABC2
LVVKHTSNGETISKKHAAVRQKTAKKAHSKTKRTSSGKGTKKRLEARQISDDSGKASARVEERAKISRRSEDEVVTYNELEFRLTETIATENQVLIGPSRLTRFEIARITGARSLQLSLGAPSLIRVSNDIRDSISLATAELDLRALPISIRRILPNGVYQDIPIDWMK